MFPGSPYSPDHPTGRRLAYAMVGLVIATLVNLGNGLLLANIQALVGASGGDLVLTSLLPGFYVACNASANLLLVKGRAQFGIPAITRVLLIGYAGAAFLLFLVPRAYCPSVLLAALSGFAAAGMTTISVYYLMQSLPRSAKPLGLVFAVGAVQLGTPLGHLVPIDFFQVGSWRSIALVQILIALVASLAIALEPLPPSDRKKAFEPLDAFTFTLVFAANILLCSVLSIGRVLWWSDAPWLGWMLAAALPLYWAALCTEALRPNPLLRLSWYGTRTIFIFASVALVVRLALAEQSFGAVGLLSISGLDDDQFHWLYVCILLAEALGIVAAAVTLSEKRIPYQILAAALLIAGGAWLDSGSDNLTRPANLMISQSLIAFGTTLFVGPALVFGAIQMLRKGGDYLVSLVVMFSITQNIGGLAGSALLGSYEIVRAKYHGAALADHMMVGDPFVAQRLRFSEEAIANAIGDPAARAVESAGLLAQSLSREAAILAFNDCFLLITFLALGSAAFLAGTIIRLKLQLSPAHGKEPHNE